MFDLFKKDIVVKCYDVEELAKLLAWMRDQYGLVEMTRKNFNVSAVMTSIFNEEQFVTHFEVAVPYHMYKPLREKAIEKEVFDSVIEQRSVAEILGRSL